MLIADSAIKMWKSGVKDKACVAIFLSAFLAFAFFQISPALLVLFGALAGIAAKELGKKSGKGKKAA